MLRILVWLCLAALLLVLAVPAAVLLYLTWLDRRQAGAPYPLKARPCRTCLDDGSPAPMDYPVIEAHVSGTIRQCPRCGRFFDFDENAFGGGRLRRVPLDELKARSPHLFAPGGILERMETEERKT